MCFLNLRANQEEYIFLVCYKFQSIAFQEGYNCICMEEKDLSVGDTQYVIVQLVYWHSCLQAYNSDKVQNESQLGLCNFREKLLMW